MSNDEALNAPPAPKKSKKGGKLIFALLGLLILLGGGGAAYYFFFVSGGAGGSGVEISTEGRTFNKTAAEEHSSQAALLAKSIMPMDEIIINIRDRQFQRVLKLSISLELTNPQDRETAESLKPILLDSFQSHLRSLRISEIEGSRAIYRIKEELLYRADIILHPITVKNILFSEMLLL